MDSDMNDVILQTLELLDWRLRRLQFVIFGDFDSQPPERTPGPQTVTARLAKLDQSLNDLMHKSQIVFEILRLHEKLPSDINDEPEASFDSVPDEEKLAMVLAEAPSFPTTASQLTSLSDLTMPEVKSFTSLISHQPRIALVQEQQEQQAKEIAELRQKSGLLLLQWHEVFVLGQGRCWAEWDKDMRGMERTVRREEKRISDE